MEPMIFVVGCQIMITFAVNSSYMRDKLYNFYLSTIVKDARGSYILEPMARGGTKNLETDFKGLRYHACKGLNAYGKPTDNYVENFPEEEAALVHVGGGVHDNTEIVLRLYFFPPNPFSSYATDAERYAAANEVYHSFLNYVAGKKLQYRDTIRKRYAAVFLSGKTEPEEDKLYGQCYIAADFIFSNIMGHTFPSSKTLLDALNNI